jgi:outer membrane protein assembly factor BamB
MKIAETAFAGNKRGRGSASAMLLLLALAAACSKSDPILPGDRSPVFKKDDIVVLDKKIDDPGALLSPEKCDYVLDGNNMIWKGEARIFAGLPTESEIRTPKTAACRGDFVYAGLSTGELVKVNAKTRDLEWTADIFAERAPTGAPPFLDIIAAPVLNGGYVYAGGLGGEFCKARDSDGAKIWCLPVGVQEILRSTKNFNFILTTDGDLLAVSADGKVYWRSSAAERDDDCDAAADCILCANISDGKSCQK